MTLARSALYPLRPLHALAGHPLAHPAAHPLAHPAVLATHWSLAALIAHLPSLAPAASLACFSALCNFTLEVSLAYLLCWLLAQFATSPGMRFTLWTSLLLAAAFAWLLTLASLANIALRSLAAAQQAHPALKSASRPDSIHNSMHSWTHHWTQTWTHSWTQTHTQIWTHTWTVPQPFAQRIGLALTVLALLYAAMLAGLGIAALYRRQRLTRALVFRSPAPASAQACFHALCAEMRIPVCTLWLLPGLPSPATLSARRPSVYLPPECLTEDPATLTDILRHELAHVYRCDARWEAIARLCRALVFFHPALRRAFAATRLERELAADRIVIRTHPDTRDLYADTLVRFGWRTAHSPNSIGISFSGATSVLHARVQSILAGEPFYSSAARRLRGLLSAATFVLCTFAAPALWVGFHLAELPASSLASSSTADASLASLKRIPALAPTPTTLHTHTTIPPLGPSAHPDQSSQTQLVATQPRTVDSPLLPDLTPAALPNVRYQNSHRTPQQPAATGSPAAQPGEPTIPGSTRGLGVPSTAVVTAAVDAAVALGRMGLGDHDHDHE